MPSNETKLSRATSAVFVALCVAGAAYIYASSAAVVVTTIESWTVTGLLALPPLVLTMAILLIIATIPVTWTLVVIASALRDALRRRDDHRQTPTATTSPPEKTT